MDNLNEKERMESSSSESDGYLKPIEENDDQFFHPSNSLTNDFSTRNDYSDSDQQSIINEKIPFPTKNYFKKEDFEFLNLLGRGSFAKVLRAKFIKNNMIVAIKIINKPFILKEDKLYQIYLENEVLMKIYHPNIIKILGIFEEGQKLYIVLEYCASGDFCEFVKNNAPLPFETAQYYTAQIVESLEYLHNIGIAHRDLKPENMMLDDKFHIKIIDFATAKIKGKQFNKETMKFEDKISSSSISPRYYFNKKRNTFVGTAEYVSPEVLNDVEAGHETDLWALGCIIYQMFTGTSPFKDKTEYLVFRKILDRKITFPESFPEVAQDLVKSLLMIDPLQRIGSGPEGSNNDYTALKNHPFFKGIKFENLNYMNIPCFEKLKLKVILKDSDTRKSTSVMSGESTKEKNELKILKEGIIRKKSPWFHYNTRRLVLYNTNKLEYLEPKKNIVKGVIYLTSECNCVYVADNRFDLITPKRTFIFKTENKDSNIWAKIINENIPK